MKEYKISVKLKTMDMFRFLMRHEYGSFSGLFGLAISILALISLLLDVAEGDRNTMIILGFLALVFTVFNPIRLFLRAQKQIVMNPSFKAPIEYTFGETGLHIAQGEEQMDVAWGDMRKLVHGKRIMVLYLSKVVGYIFPKSQCGGHFDEIAAMINLKMAQARSGAVEENSEEVAQVEATKELTEEEIERAEKRASDEESARRYKESMKKISLMRELRGGDGPNRYAMPPGEAEIWGDDEENEEEQE